MVHHHTVVDISDTGLPEHISAICVTQTRFTSKKSKQILFENIAVDVVFDKIAVLRNHWFYLMYAHIAFEFLGRNK